jgi:ribosomal protein S25
MAFPALGHLIEAADQALETLRAVSAQFNHNPRPTRRFLYREAISSSRVAGSDATLLDLLCFEEAPEFLASNLDVQDQSRYVSALDVGLKQLHRGPLDALTIQTIHAILCPETTQIRQRDDSHPEARVMVFAASTANLHPLLQAGLLHHHVITEAPFSTANDRMARILSMLILAERKEILAPCLGLSPFFEKHAAIYAQHLLSHSEDENATPWLAFFLDGVRHQAVDTTQRIQSLVEIMERHRNIVVRQGKATRSAFKVMEHMTHIPLLTARALIEKVGMSAPTAQRAIRIWLEAGVIQELTGNRSGRIYLATDLFYLATEEWLTHAA